MLIKRYQPLIALENNLYWVYRKGRVGVYDLNTRSFYNSVKLPIPQALCKYRLLERIFRYTPRAYEIVNDDSFLLAIKGKMLKIDIKCGEVSVEKEFSLGMSAPLSMCRIDNMKGFDDGIYYGDYLQDNLAKHSVSIYRRPFNNNDWTIVYSFPEGAVNHIHSIIPSVVGDYVFILTGDDDEASGIWISHNGFKSVEPLLVGNQMYRACVLFEANHKVIYCSDTPMKQNYMFICEMNGNEMKVVEQIEIPGTCLYGETNGKEIIISTAVEPNSVFEKRSFIGLITDNKLGDGIQDNRAHVIRITSDFLIDEIDSEIKDKWPMRLCQFGTALFPKYAFSKYGSIDLFYIATKGSDNEWKHIEG